MSKHHSPIDAAVEAIQSGDVDTLKRLLRENPRLPTERIGPRTLLHVATDWPGHFPGVGESIAALIRAGADPNAAFLGAHSETPLHWAASSDDVVALDALLDGGANTETSGSIIGGGTPLADAVAFGQWQAARRLVERGAQLTLAQAAALGLMPRLEERFRREPPPDAEEITASLWFACHGGQREAADFLLQRGGDVNWVGDEDLTPLDVARRSGAEDLVQWLVSKGARASKDPISIGGWRKP